MNTSDFSSISHSVQIIQAGFNFSSVLISFIILFVLLVCSALISGAEAAFFSLSPFEKDELKNDTSKAGILVSRLLDIPKQLLATILITNNFLNVAIVIVSSSILAEFFNSSGDVSEAMRFVIEVFVITLVLLIICEVIPKIVL